MNDVSVVVAVPVRNEVERLPQLLDALANQRASSFTVALFFDDCEDGSQALVEALAPSLPFTIVTDRCDARERPNAGAARQRAMALAIRHAGGGVLMTTDADSRPAHDWIAANTAGLVHADVVAGRIDLAGASSVQTRLSRYYDRLHALRRRRDPVTYEAARTHHWTSAASMAMTSATYVRTKGFPPCVNGEDAAFADRAARLGLRTRRDAAARVVTSSRRIGRASAGLAVQLAALDASQDLPLVTHPADEAWRFSMQGVARRAHGGDDYTQLASRLGLSLHEVVTVAVECANGEAFAARIVGAPSGGMRQIALGQAEILLAELAQDQLMGAA